MRHQRRIYHLNKIGQLDGIGTKELKGRFPYFMFRQENTIYVNSICNNPYTLKRQAILFDIEMMNKYKAQGKIPFKTLNGLTPKFVNELEQYNITIDDIRKAVEDGRDYNKGSDIHKDTSIQGYYISYQYTTG